MNAVICTDGTSVDDLKSLANVPDMKGLELASKFLLKNHIYGDEMLLIVSALDLGIKTNILRNLAKEIVIKVFLLMQLT
jgi:carbamoyl-phosphate synthase small subunit